MSQWSSTKARQVLTALCRTGELSTEIIAEYFLIEITTRPTSEVPPRLSRPVMRI